MNKRVYMKVSMTTEKQRRKVYHTIMSTRGIAFAELPGGWNSNIIHFIFNASEVDLLELQKRIRKKCNVQRTDLYGVVPVEYMAPPTLPPPMMRQPEPAPAEPPSTGRAMPVANNMPPVVAMPMMGPPPPVIGPIPVDPHVAPYIPGVYSNPDQGCSVM